MNILSNASLAACLVGLLLFMLFTTSEEEEMRESEPSNIHEALANNKWTQSMEEEINKLKEM